MKGLGIAAAALLLLASAGAGAQGGAQGTGSSGGNLGATGTMDSGTAGSATGGSGDRTSQPLAATPPSRAPALRGVEPRTALGQEPFSRRVDDPPRGDRDNPMPPGGDRPLRTETEHDRTGMRPAQTPGQAPAR